MMENIEHIVKQPVKRLHETPLLLLHGAWHGAWCYELWMDYFASLGYEVHSFSLPAHGKSSSNKGHINRYVLNDYVETLASQIESISPKPVVIGHSMGGAIVQKYLEKHQLPGAVLLASIPAVGILGMCMRLWLHYPVASLVGMLTMNLYDWAKTPQLAANLFLNAKTDIDPVAFRQRLGRESFSILALVFPYVKANPIKSPIFVIAAEKDAVFTLDEERKTAEKYAAKIVIIEGQAHNLMMESAWQQVADEVDRWVTDELRL